MKHQFYLFLATFIAVVNIAVAQTTIQTTGYTGTTSGSASPPPVGLTFRVTNQSGSAIVITDVGYSCATSAQHILYYSTTSLTGATAPVPTTSSWIPISTVNSPATVANTVITNNFFTGLSLVIPAGATYRFCITVQGSVRMNSGTTGSFVANGVELDVANGYWGGATFSNGCSLTGYRFFGSITFVPAGPPCPSPSNPQATGILSTSANLSWTGVSGSLGYEYIVDQNASVPFPNTPTSTSATGFTKTGLTPSTQYYLHVRNKCGTFNFSPWVDYAFTTLPPCKPPVGFRVTNLAPTSGDISWDPWPSATNYDFILDQSNQTPTSTTGGINTTSTTVNYPIGSLQENTWYYVHIRSNCPGGEQSGWSLDSFLTPIPCRAPVIKIDHVNVDEAVAYWAPVPTATHYEYVLTTSSTPPVNGTEYHFTAVHTSALDDGKDYYIHVRSHCNSIGIIDASPWATASFSTFPVSVKNAASGDFRVAAYPNPVKDMLVIEVSGNRGSNANLLLTDMSGKLLQAVKVNGAKTEVDLSTLPGGIYIVKYADDDRKEVLKITKQ